MRTNPFMAEQLKDGHHQAMASSEEI
jgi:hypothetical protein